jgi:hypothetical protein
MQRDGGSPNVALAVLIVRASRGIAVTSLSAALLFASLACGTSAPHAAGNCRPGGKSFESGTLEGLAVIGGWAQIQSRVHAEGCHALRLDPGRTIVGREVSGARALDIAFAYRSEHAVRRPLLTLPASKISLVDDGHASVVVYRGDRPLGRVARREGRGGWARVRVKLANGTLVVRVDARIARAKVGSLGPEQRFLLGGKAAREAGALFLDAFSITARGASLPPSSASTGSRGPAGANDSPSGAGTGSQQPPTTGGTGGGGPGTGGGFGAPARPFAADSFWNSPLPAGAPLDPASGALASELRRQLGLGSPWINTTSYSTPVYRVPANQPTVRVALDVANTPLQQAWEAVPIPPYARPANGTDKSMVVWQPATDTMWEFWLMQRTDGSWHARWGGRITGASHNPAYYTGAERNWGVPATSLPLLGGVITLDDLNRGTIDHALAIAIPEARKDWWTWPAQRTDGKKDDPSAIPEGARFRLDPTLNLDSLHLYPLVRMMAEAAQRYGIVVKDQSGVVAFAGEDPTPSGSNPWSGPAGWFSGQYPSTLVQQFPWGHLQALRTEQQCCGSR